MCDCFDDIFNKLQCRFRKGYSTQQCLSKMLKNANVKLIKKSSVHCEQVYPKRLTVWIMNSSL